MLVRSGNGARDKLSRNRKLSYPCCIYCGAQTTKRTDEHVIPKALGGGLYGNGELRLLEASCALCQYWIGLFESPILLKIFRGAAQHLPLETKRKRKLRDLSVYSDGQIEVRKLPPEDHLVIHKVPILPRAGLLVGRDPKEHLFDTSLGSFNYGWQEDLAVRAMAQGNKFWIFAEFKYLDFARFLTKIAHGYAVHKLGFDFEFMGTDLILGRRWNCPSQVGCQWRIADSAELHYLSLETILVEGESYYVVYIWLFCPVDRTQEVPVFEVVIGRPWAR